MTRIPCLYLIVTATLLAAPTVSYAQEQEAVARDSIAQPEAAPAQAERQAVPRGSRPRDDNPQTGTAVPRGERRRAAPPPTAAPVPVNPGRAAGRRAPVPPRGRTVIVRPPSVYNNYYYYPRRSHPYGYGAFGLGYFYYDPYTWYPGYSYYPSYPHSGFSHNPYAFDIGEVRLQVSPRYAQVYVDGYYAGTVDDFDGVLQSLKMESGPYHIEIVAPGYETLEFDVRISPGQKINYRGDLRRLP